MGKLRKILGGLGLACFSVIVTLLALEVALRLFYPGIGALRGIITQAPDGDPRAYVLKPGARISFTGLHQRMDEPVAWNVNAQGIRSDRELKRKERKFRIATFGDSETFGWSVKAQDTFQRQMEGIDSRVEVINLGVPGYNIEDVSDAMSATMPGLDADAIFYMLHKNDLDPRLTFTKGFARSYLYLFYQKSRERISHAIWPEGKGSSLSPERLALLVRYADRMAALAASEGVPFVIGLMDSRYIEHLPSKMRKRCEPAEGVPPCAKTGRKSWTGALDIDTIRGTHQRIDGHMAPAAHREIAALLCNVFSSGRDKSCVLPGWR